MKHEQETSAKKALEIIVNINCKVETNLLLLVVPIYGHWSFILSTIWRFWHCLTLSLDTCNVTTLDFLPCTSAQLLGIRFFRIIFTVEDIWNLSQLPITSSLIRPNSIWTVPCPSITNCSSILDWNILVAVVALQEWFVTLPSMPTRLAYWDTIFEIVLTPIACMVYHQFPLGFTSGLQ